MYTFGEIPTNQGTEQFDSNVSPDKRALTLTFSAFEVTVGKNKSPANMSSKVFSLVLPVQGDGKSVEMEFIVQGFCLTPEGATATMICTVNGQTTVADFPGNSNESIQKTLKFTAPSASECRLTVFLLVGRDAKKSGVEAYLNVNAIDAEFLPRAPQPTR